MPKQPATTKTAVTKTATKKTATTKTPATKDAAARLKPKPEPHPSASLREFSAVLGKRVDDDDVAGFLERHDVRPDPTDGLSGEPRVVYWRNDDAGVIVTTENGVAVAVAVDDRFCGELYDGVAFRTSRTAVGRILGDVVSAEGSRDTFRVDEHRVVCRFGKGLAGVDVEPWRHQLERAARDSDACASAPDVVVASRPPLAEPWATELPSVTALRALLGQRAADTVLARLEAAGHLRRDGSENGALLLADDAGITVAVDAAGVVDSVHVGMHWCGGYEDGFVAGAVGRKEARARYGPPTHEASSFDIWEGDGLRRQVSYLAGHVLSWQVRPT